MFWKNMAAPLLGPSEVVNGIHLINDVAEFRYFLCLSRPPPCAAPLKHQPQDSWQVAMMKQDTALSRVKWTRQRLNKDRVFCLVRRRRGEEEVGEAMCSVLPLKKRAWRLALAATLAHMSVWFGKLNLIALPMRQSLWMQQERNLFFHSSDFVVCQIAAKEFTSSPQTTTCGT